MRCLTCGKQIGPIRSLTDRRYCCDDHRKAVRKSARLLREIGDTGDLEEPWLTTTTPAEQRVHGTGGFVAIGIGLLACLVVLLLTFPPNRERISGGRSTPLPLALPEGIEKALPAAPPLSLREDFQAGLSAWTGPPGGNPGWSMGGGKVRPRQLLLWKPTIGMRNYELTFQAEIEQKAVAWVFRAPDADNHYAVKILAGEPGAGRRATIVRYVVTGGRKSDPVNLPLPLPLQTRTPYQIAVRVKADQFATLIDDQVVDAWRDSRHAKGGVGFFSDPGEEASVSWVRVAGADSLLDRLRVFSLILPPGN
jgi:hypothetical protein